ncbi:MAG: J domain-containing protein [Ruminococcaceae bacterium]|nr:J domain-containing protein [Oscillospiraceae bacterium]
MNDPFKILGVSRDATDAEIKDAYRKLARKYHPDNFANDETARAMAEEKMKEINEAYDAVQEQRKNGSYSGGSDTSDNHSKYVSVRQYINARRIGEADSILESIPLNERGAQWHFLKGCVCASKGWYFDAQSYFTTACNMDPNNAEYRNALNNMRSASQSYSGGYNTSTMQGCSGCDLCSSLLCADCLCELCGGDLIACC